MQLKKEIVVFTHNDADALGSMLNIEFALPNISKKFFHTNYRNIEDIVNNTIDYVSSNVISALFITDVSFAQHPDLLQKLVDLNIKTVYIDHHQYPTAFFNKFPTIMYKHDITKSATLLTHEFFNNQGKNNSLDNITDVIDVYDLWQRNHARFKESMEFNEYFWNCDITWLFDNIVANNYNLPSNYQPIVDNYRIKSIEALDKFYKNKLIHSDGTTTIAFCDEYFNDVLVKEFDAGIKFLLIANSFGIIRVRFNEFSDISDETKMKIKTQILGEAEIGHLNAFAIRTKSGFDNIMNEIKRISNIISEITKG